jgi:uncharacterized membrane protein (DUF485 family)
MDTPNSAEAIRARSRRLRSVVTVMVFGLAALLTMERFSAAAISAVRGGGWEWLASQVAAAVPEVVYLLALWWVRQALAAFAAGELFTPAVARTLHRVGLTLAIGALLNTFVVPALQTMVGRGPGYLIAYDIGGLVLGAVGLSLSMVAALFTHASALQSELDEIF